MLIVVILFFEEVPMVNLEMKNLGKISSSVKTIINSKLDSEIIIQEEKIISENS
jgi:hypothetical protein